MSGDIEHRDLLARLRAANERMRRLREDAGSADNVIRTRVERHLEAAEETLGDLNVRVTEWPAAGSYARRLLEQGLSRVESEMVFAKAELEAASAEERYDMRRFPRATPRAFSEEVRLVEDTSDETFWFRESQRVAQLGTYRFDVAADSWQSSGMLDEIFGIDDTHPKTTAGWLDIVHPDDRDEMASSLQEYVAGARPRFDHNYRILRPSDQQVRWVHALGETVSEGSSGGLALIGSVQDITERVEAAEELRRSHALLNSVMTAASEAIFVKDLDGKYLYVNDAACKLLHKSVDEIIGSDSYGDFRREDAERQREDDLRVLESGRSITIDERMILPDGQEHRFMTTKGALADPDGKVQGLYGIARDITQRHAAEEAAKFQASVLQQVRNAIAAMDLEGRVVYWNEAAEEMLGWSAEEVMGRSTIGLMVPEDSAEAVREALGSLLETGAWEGEWEIKRKDGTALQARYRLGLLRGPDGARLGAIAIGEDISEQRAAQSDLEESERRLDEAQRIAHLGSWVVDPVAKTTVWSDEACRIFGIEPDSKQRSIEEDLQLVHPDDRAAARRWIGDAIGGRAPIAGLDMRVIRPDGTERVVRAEGQVIFDDGGRPVSVVGTMHDVSSSHAAQKALEAEEVKFRALFESAADAIVVVSAEGEILMANERAEAQFGYPREELIGEALESLVPQDERAKRRELQQAYEAHPEHHRVARVQDLEALRRDGSTFPAEISLAHIETAEGPVTMATVTDITGRKRVAEAVLRGEAERQANLAKTEFLARMSHELRTPLNAILGFAQLLELEQLGEPNDEGVTQILRAGQHLLELIDDVLDISRIETATLWTTTQAVPVTDYVIAAMDLMAPAAADHGVNLALDVGALPKFDVWADPRRLRQVLLNLLSNAIKYNRPGGAVTVGVGDRSDLVAIEISDTGIGIAPEDLDRIWQPFSRIDHTELSVEGHGLGLSVTKALIEAMGGEIQVTSTVGSGTSFTVSLRKADGLMPVTDEETTNAPMPESSALILYIEDNRDNARLVERVLEMRPHLTLVVATTGEDGLAIADERVPTVILLDLSLPDLDGEECLRRLKGSERTQDIPVVVISGVSDPVTIERMGFLGANSYQVKPLDVHELLSLLDELTAAPPAPEAGG